MSTFPFPKRKDEPPPTTLDRKEKQGDRLNQQQEGAQQQQQLQQQQADLVLSSQQQQQQQQPTKRMTVSELVERREAKEKARRKDGKGKTLGKALRNSDARNVSGWEDTDDDSSLMLGAEDASLSTLGIRTFKDSLAFKRKMFTGTGPQIEKLFTYTNHQETWIKEQPKACDMYAEATASGQDDQEWRIKANKFFESGMIGSSRDDKSLFAEVTGSGWKAATNTPTTTSDPFATILAATTPRGKNASSSSRRRREEENEDLFAKREETQPTFVPSIFNPHPLFDKKLIEHEHAAAALRAASELQKLHEITNKFGVAKDTQDVLNEAAAAAEIDKQDVLARAKSALLDPSTIVREKALLAKMKEEEAVQAENASAIAEWSSLCDPEYAGLAIARLKQANKAEKLLLRQQQQEEQGIDDDANSISTYQMVFEAVDVDYNIEAPVLDNSLYFGEAAKLRFFGKYHQLSANMHKNGTFAGISFTKARRGPTAAMLPLEAKHLLLSPRTRFLTRFLENMDQPPLPVIIRSSPECNEINLANMGLGDDYALLLCEVLTELPNVSTTNLSGNKITDRSMGPIIKQLSQQTHIAHVDFSDNKIDSITAKALADLVESSKCPLKSLKLRAADLDDQEVALFIAAFGKNSTILSLDLSSNMVGAASEQGCVAIAQALSLNSALNSLDLGWNKVGPASCFHIARAIADSKSLVRLSLAYNGIKDAGAESIGGALFNNKTLLHLDLSANGISGVGCFVLSCALRVNRTLLLLDLSGNPIGVAGGRALMQTLNYPVMSNNEGGVDRQILMHQSTFPEEGSGGDGKELSAYPTGVYSLDLGRVHDRCIFMELFHRASTRRGNIIEKLTYSLAAADKQQAKGARGGGGGGATKLNQIKLARPSNPSSLMGPAYGPWKQKEKRQRHPHTLLEAEQWFELVQKLSLVEGSTGKAWTLPSSGLLLVEFWSYPRVSTPIECLNSTGLRRFKHLLTTHKDLQGELLKLAQSFVLETSQLEEIVTTYAVKERCEVFSKLIETVRDTTNLDSLMRKLFDQDLKRTLVELQHRLRPALFGIIFNSYCGHFKFDLAHIQDRVAALRLYELNVEEICYIKRAVPSYASDAKHSYTSQHGQRTNFRNIVLTGRAKFVPKEADMAVAAAAGSDEVAALEASAAAKNELVDAYFAFGLADKSPGSIELDYVATSRPAEGVSPIADAALDSILLSRHLRSFATSVPKILAQEEEKRVSQQKWEGEGGALKGGGGGGRLGLLQQLARSHQVDEGGAWLTAPHSLSQEMTSITGSEYLATQRLTRAELDLMEHDIVDDRAIYYCGADSSLARLVVRVAVRIHSLNLSLLSYSSLVASVPGTPHQNSRKGHHKGRRNSELTSSQRSSGSLHGSSSITSSVPKEGEEERSLGSILEACSVYKFTPTQQELASSFSSSPSSPSSPEFGRKALSTGVFPILGYKANYEGPLEAAPFVRQLQAFELNTEVSCLPSHKQFSFGEDMATNGSELFLCLPLHDATSSESVIMATVNRLQALFHGFDVKPRDVRVTHSSIVESDKELVGFPSVACQHCLLLHRLDLTIDSMPYAPKGVFKTMALPMNNFFAQKQEEGSPTTSLPTTSILHSVWRWREINADDRDVLLVGGSGIDSSGSAFAWPYKLVLLKLLCSHLWLSASQAGEIAMDFPVSYRQDVVCCLYPRIVDIENFNDVLDKCLAPETHPAIYRRLGVLNTINLFRLEGRCLDLDLSIRDNHLLVELLVELDIFEPGRLLLPEHLFFKRNYISDFIPGWDIPASWCVETYVGNLSPGVPKEGNFVAKTAPTCDMATTEMKRRQKHTHFFLHSIPRGDGSDYRSLPSQLDFDDLLR